MPQDDSGLTDPAPLDRLTIRALVHDTLREDGADQDLTRRELGEIGTDKCEVVA